MLAVVLAALLLGFSTRQLIGCQPGIAGNASASPFLSPVLSPPVSHVLHRS
jgi:hypothetical protein